MIVRSLAAASLAFGAAALAGPPLIALLRRLSYRQHAYEDAPSTHQVKSGTPTMGGVLFLLGPLAGIACARDATSLPVAVATFGCAAIGAIDDVSSIRSGRNRGLRAREKFLGTAVVGAIALALLARTSEARVSVFPLGTPLAPWLWFGLGLAVIAATTHAVNLTDGLDGLAGGTFLPPLAVVWFLAERNGAEGTATILAGIGGAILGFLIYNRYPARMFMGDTGSLALGGALAAGAVVAGAQLLLPLIGGVFVAETLSVILQVASYKTTRRRIFRMSPLHHHFELAGWPETKVTARFWTASCALAAAGFLWVSART